MKRVIAIGLAPNIQKSDAYAACRLLFSPWQYLSGKTIKILEHWFEQYFQVTTAISFINARSALYAIFKNLEIGKGDEVLLQAFTCVAVPNAILAVDAVPVYVDIDNSLNIDLRDLERKITKKTKAILVQHTFGIAADMDAVMKLAKKYNLFVVEDVAHSIGGEYKGKKLGTFGIAGIFSFGRDKAFSSVFGGVAITNDSHLGERLHTYQKQRDFPSAGWVIAQLFYPIISYIILKTYYFFSFGKVFHFLLRKVRFFSLPVTEDEEKGKFNILDVKKMPNALAMLAMVQINKLEQYNKKRKRFAAMYRVAVNTLNIEQFTIDDNPLLRFPLLAADKKDMKQFFARQGMYIGDWYNQVIDPRGVDLKKAGYKIGTCPKAEEIVRHSINLPTYPTMDQKDVERVIGVLKEYVK